MTDAELQQITKILCSGGVISYPTEAIFGLGCDPLNESAVLNLLSLKNRDVKKGLILLASSFEQVLPFIKLPSNDIMKPVLASWPGPYTWLLPKAASAPAWLTGEHDKIAIRITDHPIIKAICSATKMPLVSTSANPSGSPAVQTSKQVSAYFPTQLDYIVSGDIIGDNKASTIIDALSGLLIRE